MEGDIDIDTYVLLIYIMLLCLHPPARTQASFKEPGCSYNCRWL